MNKIRFTSVAVILITVSVLSRPAGAQEKTKEERELELRIQEEIDQQKKAMTEQRKFLDEQLLLKDSQLRSIDEAMKALDKVKTEDLPKYRDVMKEFRFDREGPFPFGDTYVFTPGVEPFYGQGLGSDSERTTWNFSKNIKENSFSGDYTFDIENTANAVVMKVNGNCKEGEIRVKIIMPDGKTYSEIVIDESGDLNWRKSFKISEEENADKTGAWKFRIKASKATGYFRISLQTF